MPSRVVMCDRLCEMETVLPHRQIPGSQSRRSLSELPGARRPHRYPHGVSLTHDRGRSLAAPDTRRPRDSTPTKHGTPATAGTAITSRSSAGCSGSCSCWPSRRSRCLGHVRDDPRLHRAGRSPDRAWVSPVLGTVMYFWGGRPFLTGAVSEIRSRTPGMMLLIGLAITVAFVSSWGASLGVLRPPARLLVGAGAADRDHAARPLDRDAVAGADHARRWTRWPRCCPTRPSGSSRRRQSTRSHRRSCGSATS